MLYFVYKLFAYGEIVYSNMWQHWFLFPTWRHVFYTHREWDICIPLDLLSYLEIAFDPLLFRRALGTSKTFFSKFLLYKRGP